MFVLDSILLINILITFLSIICCYPNVLFIIIDDLRPTLSSYGDNTAITPNIDQIANNGLLFNNAFAQQSLCAPSRTSLLTSRRPDSLRLYDSHSYWRKSVANFTTLPQYFKRFGYFTQSVGKVFHPGIVSNHSDDYPISWSAPPFHGSTERYKFSAVCPESDGHLYTNIVCPVDVKQQPEQTLPDIQSTQFAIDFIRNYDTIKGKPFFLALGYHKPHIPLKCPKKYWDLYPKSSIDLAPNRFLPKHFPEVAWNPWTDLRQRHDISELNITLPFGTIPDYYQTYIRQSYYACVSYIDDLIGQVLSAMSQKQLNNRTIIVLTGDHGWSMGEHNEWSKYSNFDTALRVPLIIWLPNSEPVFNYTYSSDNSSKVARKRFNRIDRMVELVDVMPTLAELARLPVPPVCSHPTQLLCTEGASLKPLIDSHMSNNNKVPKWKSFAFSQYPRPSLKPQNNSDQPKLKDIKIMGYSMRSSSLRYTEWIGFDPKTFTAHWDQVLARELYFGQQNYNWAEDKRMTLLVHYLSKLLRKGWRHQIKSSQ